MCGIAGLYDMRDRQVPSREMLETMIAAQRHRGPNGFGFLSGPGIGMAHARLSIIDLEGGWQPLGNESGSIWVTYNGEIYNYQELRAELVKKGHRFQTRTDTEVLVHLYEDCGFPAMLDRLNGQYSFALWDARAGILYLIRDHVGIHPLHYQVNGAWLRFSSEVKGLVAASPESSELDPEALDQTFTFWGPLSGRSLFKGIEEVPPGHYLKVNGEKRELIRYWDVPLSGEPLDTDRSLESYSEELRELLEDATRIRLIADVPVGAYLSGGLDSSVVTRLTRDHNGKNLRTFSVAFEDKDFDESGYQKILNDVLSTDNSAIKVSGQSISDAFEKVIWHTERPVLRTAPTPLYLLSGSVRNADYRTVLTGEGSDEFLGGYDIYKEAVLRSFWMRDPDSNFRASLFRKLYPYLKNFSQRPDDFLREYFKLPSPGWDEMFASHWVRWMTTSRIKRFYEEEFRRSLGGYDPVIQFQEDLRERILDMGTLARAQYLEISTLLPGYLLSSQGDRMAMAHSVEVRFPFLDRRVIDFSCRVPSHYKLMGLNEKLVLKRSMRGQLPEQILRRHKKPYMAPDIPSFIDTDGNFHPVVHDHLSEKKLRGHGVFKPEMVAHLLKKCVSGRAIGFGDSMTFVGILSTQIWLDSFAGSRPIDSRPVRDEEIRVDHVLTGGNNGQHSR